jgi:hypothetical protein
MMRLGWWMLATAPAAHLYSCSYSSAASGAGSGGGGLHLNMGGLLVVGFGLLLLYGGLKNYRISRSLGTSPLIAIRSLADGLVHIVGKAVGEDRLTSPITRQPCFYYQVLIENWVPSRTGPGQWTMCLRQTEHRKFCLQDGTGKVAVDLHQALLDLTRTFQTELGRRTTADPSGASGPSDSELRDYLCRANAQIHAELDSRRESRFQAITHTEDSVSLLPADFSPRDGGPRLQFTENCLLAEREYNILGTCLDNPNPGDKDARKLIARGPTAATFLISCKAEPELEKQTKRSTYALYALGTVLVIAGVALLLR